MAKYHSWPSTYPELGPMKTPPGSSSLSDIEPPVSVKPKECIQCFSKKIKVGFLYDSYVCECEECGRQWEERVRPGDRI